ncbi:hypothetical protein G3I51_13550 [Streptomyces sp. SID9944]|nr:hypothetical protein [Streptomyces sp. SID9944]
MNQLSPDARAVVRAADAMTTQVRRIADALATPVVRTEVVADDDATTPVDGPTALRDMAATLRYIDPEGFREAADCCEARAFAIEHGQAKAPTADAEAPVVTVHGDPDMSPAAREAVGALADVAVRQATGACAHCGGAHAWDGCEAYTKLVAADDAQRTARRRSIGTLLARAAAGLTPDEDALLRQHVEAEIREGSAARVELDSLRADLRRDQAQQWPQRLGRAEAAIERVRALATDMRTWASPRGIATQYADHIERALDGSEQPTDDTR